MLGRKMEEAKRGDAIPHQEREFPTPYAPVFADAFFATITVPTMIVGGTLDTTVPFAANQQRPSTRSRPAPRSTRSRS